jgi:Holliday junction resolvasome RuvABC DNA-binding subunit
MKPSKSEKEAIETLNSLGYQVTLKKPTTKKTFEVEIETLHEFLNYQHKSGLKVKEAIQEALSDWIKKMTRRQN